MKLLSAILLLLVTLFAEAQPPSYTPGTQVCWTFNGRAHGYFRAAGWDSAVDHVLIFFGGMGQVDCASYDGMEPGLILRDGSGGNNWNGVTSLPGGASRKWMVFIMTNHGNQPNVYRDDIGYFLTHAGVGIDTSKHGRIHIAGGSLGPGNAQNFLSNTSNNPWRSIFSTGIWMSTSFTTVAPAIPRLNYCWYGENDTNGGTPPSATVNFYNQCPGDGNVDKWLNFTPGGDHNNATWGDCFRVTGTTEATNRWIWMINRGEAMDVPTVTYPAAHKLDIRPAHVFDITQARHHPEALFDGDLNTACFRNFFNGYIIESTNGQLAWIVLDSFIRHPRVEVFNGAFSTGGIVSFQFFYDWTDTTRHSPVYQTTLPGNAWKFVDSANSRTWPDSSRLVLMRIATGASDNFFEARIHANVIGPAASIAPPPGSGPPDPGKAFQRYNKLQVDTTMDDVGNGQRAITDVDYLDTVTVGNITPNWGKKLVINRFGNSLRDGYMPAVRGGRNPHITLSGLRLKFKQPSLSNDSKDIPLGSDSLNIDNWIAVRNTVFGLVAKMGFNPNADTTGYQIGPEPGWGLGLIKEIEVGNEDDARWAGNLRFHSPRVKLRKLKQGYAGAKAADPSIKVISGALTGVDSSYFKALYLENLIEYKTKVPPFDIQAMNEYATNAGGQHAGASHGVTPEKFKLLEKQQAVIAVRDKYYPNMPVYCTEIGYDTHESGYGVINVTGQTRQETKAYWTMRSYELTAASRFSALYLFTHKEGGGGDFSTTGCSYDTLCVSPPNNLPSYLHQFVDAGKLNSSNVWISLPRPLYWHMTMRNKILENYNAWPTIITNGDTSGTWVLRYTHKTNSDSLVYSIWRGTDNGSILTNYALNVPGAAAAQVAHAFVSLKYGQITNLTPAAGMVTIPMVDESVQYVSVSLATGVQDNIIKRNRGQSWNVISP